MAALAKVQSKVVELVAAAVELAAAAAGSDTPDFSDSSGLGFPDLDNLDSAKN